MMNRKKWMLAGFLLVLVAASGGYFYVFVWSRHHHRSVQNEKGTPVPASVLASEFVANEQTANQKFLDKTLVVSGKLLEQGTNTEGRVTLLLEGDPASLTHVFCTLKNTGAIPVKGTQVTIKGICTGFLTEVILIDAILIPQ